MSEQDGIPLKCFMNGYPRTMLLSDARQLFWKVRIAWLRPLDWMRVGHGSRARQGNGTAFMQDRVACFAYKLLTRGSLAIRVDDDCLADEHGDSPRRGTVAAWACRFGSIFKDFTALESVRTTDDRGIRELAYRMKPGVEWLLIVGVDHKSVVPDLAVDWRIFLTRPSEEHSESASCD